MKKIYPKVGIITVNFNGKKYLKKLFTSIAALTYPKNRISVICVDNGSTDGSLQFVKKNFPSVRVIRNDANNYCKALNLGVKNAGEAEFIALVNTDVWLEKNWLAELVRVLSRNKNAGAAGGTLLDLQGNIQNAAHYELPNFYWGEQDAGKRTTAKTTREVESLCGAAVLYREKFLSEAGPFDEDFVIYYEDVDMSLRLRQKGHALFFVPSSTAHHVFHGSSDETFARNYIERNRLLFLAKHYPNKLSSSLVGAGYFTAQKSADSSGKIYAFFPDMIMKLIRSHSAEVSSAAVRELFTEIRKIVNYDNDVLAKEINKITEDRNKTYEDRKQVLDELQRKLRELEEKEGQLKARDAQINKLKEELVWNQEAGKHVSDEFREKLEELAEKESQLKARDAQINGLRNELLRNHEAGKQVSEELWSKRQELADKTRRAAEREADVSRLKEMLEQKEAAERKILSELQQKSGLLENSEGQRDRLQKEIEAYKQELSALSAQVRSSLTEALRRDGQLAEREAEISRLKNALAQKEEAERKIVDELRQKSGLLENNEGQRDRLQKEIEAYKQELSALSAQVRSNIAEALRKDGQLEMSAGEIGRLKEMLEQKEAAERKILSELQQKSDLLEDNEGERKNLRKEIEAYTQELSALSMQLRSGIEEAARKDNQLATSTAEIEQLKEILEQKAAAERKIADELRQKRDLLEDNKNERDSLQKEIATYKQELDTLSAHLRSRMDEALRKDGRLVEREAEISRLEDALTQKEEEEKRLLSELEQKVSLLEEKAGQVEEQKAQIDRLYKEISCKEEQLSGQKTQLDKLKEELEGYRQETTVLSTQLRSRMDEALRKDGRLVEREAEVGALREELSRMAEDLAGRVLALEEGRKKIEEQEQELVRYKSELENISGQLRVRMDQILLKDGQLAEKGAEIERLGEDLRSWDMKVKELQAELSNLQKQLHSRMDEVLVKDGQLIEKNAEICALREELSGLAADIADKMVAIDEGKARIAEREATLTEKEIEIKYHKDEISNLSSQLRSRMDEVLLKNRQLIDKDAGIGKLEKELSGIYNSEGFRFILRPLWTLLWNARQAVTVAEKKTAEIFWGGVAAALTPLYLLLGLAFLAEYAAWIILRPVLQPLAPRRKIQPVSADAGISIVIPNWNGEQLLKDCLPSIFSSEGFSGRQNEVLIVDDGSTDGSVEFIRTHFPQVRLIRNKKNRGFGYTCNRGVREAKNEIVVLINNDIILTPDFLQPLVAHLEKEDVFTVTPKLYGWDRKTFQWGMHMGHFENGYIRLWNEAETGNGDKVSRTAPSIFAIGGALVFRKNDFLWLGGFDPLYRPNCWEDIDISYRALKRGMKVLYEPSSLMYHKGRATLTYERPKEIKNELLFTWKNITDGAILRNHLNLLPRNLAVNRMAFLRGFLWALDYLPSMLFQRLMERRFIAEPDDKAIFDRPMLHYKNLERSGFSSREDEKPTVLLISRFMPYPLNAGGKIRIYNMIKRLADKYNFILLSLIDHEDELKDIPKLKGLFSEIHPILAKSPLNLSLVSELFYPELYKFGYSYSQELVDTLKKLQETKAIDIVQIESNELLYVVDAIAHAPVVYTEHDISILCPGKSYYKGDKGFLWSFVDQLKRMNFHNGQFKKLSKVVTLSREDEYVLRRLFPKADLTLIPTGVDLRHFSPLPGPRRSRKLVFVGHYRHYPNEDAIVYFAKSIFPIIRRKMPDVELLIVGSNPTPHVEKLAGEKNVVLVGGVEDVKPYLDQASVFVNSVRLSAGIKGKVLEAMACGVPVVSTRVGSSGIDAQPGKEILIADNARGFARHVLRLLGDEALRRKLAAGGRKLVERRYDWNQSAAGMDMVYRDLLASAGYEQAKFSTTEKIVNRVKDFVERRIEQTNADLTRPSGGPEEIHIELTYNCNSRCIMCDLWDLHKRCGGTPQKELSLDEIRRFVDESRFLHDSRTVVLSGGEPFLRNDLVDICGSFTRRLPQSSVGILTNGLSTETIVSKTREILDRFNPKSLWLGSSLDGIGQGHDTIRGTNGAFQSFCKTITRCKKELPGVRLSATFTLTPYNIDQLIPAKRFADNEGLDFFAQFVVPKEGREEFIWTPQSLNLAEREIMQIVQEIIARADQQELLGAMDRVRNKHVLSQIYYWSHLLKFQTNPQRFFKKCVSGAKFAMFNPYGDLFFCPHHKKSRIGNIREEKFDDLWKSEKAEHMRGFIRDGNCHCWLVCIVFPVLEKAFTAKE